MFTDEVWQLGHRRIARSRHSRLARARPMPPGDVRTFNMHTGEQKFIFETVPQEGNSGNETWGEGSWKDLGGTNVWLMMSLDPALGYVYLPVSTPSSRLTAMDLTRAGTFGCGRWAAARLTIPCCATSKSKRIWAGPRTPFRC